MSKLDWIFMKRRAQDYRAAFTTAAGARVLRDMMRAFHMARPTHVDGDPYASAFKEGQRSVILLILNKLEVANDPDRFLQEIENGRSDYESTPSISPGANGSAPASGFFK